MRKAEKELEYQTWKAPPALKQWLQITFDKETKHFQHKRAIALKQMKEAKEAVSGDVNPSVEKLLSYSLFIDLHQTSKIKVAFFSI